MSAVDIIRAWKDEEYRLSLSAEQWNLLPEHPVGEVEVDEVDLEVGFGVQSMISHDHGCLLSCT